MTTSYNIDDVLRIMERLRDPLHGCPWDQAQDFQSIVPSTLEECYELAAAIEAHDYPHVADELGDVLFQVVFYAQLGAEQGYFSFGEVVQNLAEKLLRRHPHVFRDGLIEGVVHEKTEVAAVKKSWESIKAQERAGKAQHGTLDDVPRNLPALPRAQKLQKRAARVGFDWPATEPVFDKLDEELGELREALLLGDQDAIEDELGDLLFTVVNLARHQRVDAEAALRRASLKFERRFRTMESAAVDDGRSLDGMTATEFESRWKAAKAEES